jgi:hypothetical protein
MHSRPIPQFDAWRSSPRVFQTGDEKRYIFDAGKANQVQVLMKEDRRLRLEQLSFRKRVQGGCYTLG